METPEEAVVEEPDPVVIITLSSPNIIKQCLLLPGSPVTIDAVNTTPEMAVDMFIRYIDDLAIANGGQFAFFREGNRIPLHYQCFSCSNEQIFTNKVVGDRKWVTEMLTNNLSLGRYIIITGSEGKEKITSKFVGGFDKVMSQDNSKDDFPELN